MATTLTYRPDIDGLRAIAVLAVVLYHVGFTAFPGGYVGVDVFFVISGFLITQILRKQIGEGSFSFATFYYRRARRLLPAAFTVFAVTGVFAFLLLPAADLKEFGGALASAVLSVSNFYFWQQAGYFDTAAELKPLLHTWSLSVEEQFYLFWPLTLLLLLKLGRTVIPVIALILAGAASLYFAEAHLSEDGAATFYLLPYRVCEFAVGALLAWVSPHQPKWKWTLEPIFLAGLALVLWPVFTYDHLETPFPGISAMWPCIGTALMIYAGRAQVLGHLVSNPVMVRIGLWSYSLYLVHWPIIVFYRFYAFDDPGPVAQVGLLAASFVAAFLLYTLVETPLRKSQSLGQGLPAKALVASLVVTAAASVGGGYWLYQGDGLKQRIAEAPTSYAADDPERPRRGIRRQSELTERLNRRFTFLRSYELGSEAPDARTVLVLGDSHAGRIDAFATYLGQRHNLRFVFAWRTGCFNMLDARGTQFLQGPRSRTGVNCRFIRNQMLKLVEEEPFNYVLFAGRWTQYFEPVAYGEAEIDRRYFIWRERPVTDIDAARNYFETKMRSAVDLFHDHVDRVILVSQPPPPRRNLRGCASSPPYLIPVARHAERCAGVPREIGLTRTAFVDQAFRDIAEQSGALAIIPSDYLCPEGVTMCLGYADGRQLFTDHNHLSIEGSHLLAREVEADGLFPIPVRPVIASALPAKD